MKNKLLLLIAAILILALNSTAQIIQTELVMAPESSIPGFKSSAKIVKASVNNLITMYNMTTLEWETEMKKLPDYKGPYYNPDVSGAPVEYTTSINTSIHSVLKTPSSISIDYLHASMPSVMENLFNELEPYYVGYENGLQIFFVTKNGIKYKFFLSRSEDGDLVVMGVPRG